MSQLEDELRERGESLIQRMIREKLETEQRVRVSNSSKTPAEVLEETRLAQIELRRQIDNGEVTVIYHKGIFYRAEGLRFDDPRLKEQ